MRNFMKTLALTSILIAGLAAAPALYAQEPQSRQGPDSSMKRPDMQHMKKMMDMCGNMMQGGIMGDPRSQKSDKK